jgi:circadian clock protein KaiB
MGTSAYRIGIQKNWSPMMKARRREGGRTATAKGAIYVFRLFVAGNESNSAQARGNLARLCEEHLKGRYKIETVDVLKDAAAAHKNNVLVTPTLILIEPRPKVTLLGNLNDSRQVLAALRLTGDER